MKRLIIILLFTISAFSQKKKENLDFQLDRIKDFRIKIDGGCSFFSPDSISLKNEEYIFVISAKRRAFISLKNQHDYIYLKQIKSEKLNLEKNKYTFSGEGFEAILIIEKPNLQKTPAIKYYCKGILEVNNKKYKHIYNLRGKVVD